MVIAITNSNYCPACHTTSDSVHMDQISTAKFCTALIGRSTCDYAALEECNCSGTPTTTTTTIRVSGYRARVVAALGTVTGELGIAVFDG